MIHVLSNPVIGRRTFWLDMAFSSWKALLSLLDTRRYQLSCCVGFFFFKCLVLQRKELGSCFWSQDPELVGRCVYNWCGLRIKACFHPTRSGVQKKKKQGIGRFLAFALGHWRFYGSDDVGAYYGSREGDCGECLGKLRLDFFFRGRDGMTHESLAPCRA